jgi:hypothetical protein
MTDRCLSPGSLRVPTLLVKPLPSTCESWKNQAWFAAPGAAAKTFGSWISGVWKTPAASLTQFQNNGTTLLPACANLSRIRRKFPLRVPFADKCFPKPRCWLPLSYLFCELYLGITIA